MMLTDLIPMIEKTYRVLPGRENHTIAGLSMEGFQTLRTTLSHLDEFACFGGFGGSTGSFGAQFDSRTSEGGVFADAFDKKVKLLWIGMGTEQPEPFPKAIGEFRKMLDGAGVNYVYLSPPGTSHEWLTWRRDLNDFAPRLFH